MYIVVCYAVYLAISLAVTVWVARSLHRNSRVFLVEAFPGNAELANSLNRLLVLAFCLVNIGFVTLPLRITGSLNSVREATDLVCDNIGHVLLVLGLVHFLNLYVLSRFGRRGRERQAQPRSRPAAGGAWGPEGAPIGKVLD
ncbi:MAG: hypothetical protein ABSH32_03635 [Bryobacteraceae bacterium]|jgi:hypothetical protein